ncbi:hypothetical protein AMAG_12414 [Allomyces macrogynus ATCC 38327]|uniref:YqaJ viral recombinase domain-containing protein n=1 Tax=Allomyces macrogynus (strain ATCC 38327) TaxID=578462 RepID=A0A0L0SZC6_ALLM3|nr:hypothetical protein AMAG_12414 [Allomyces macrogynus ATCC 38327]|eukprot:KNE67679.1 hypothetical protein AMAG_12414 [Allomyces macrogynus ATCC 38327]
MAATRTSSALAASGAERRKMWTFFASNVAAAIGRNPYKPPSEIAKFMWQRAAPEQYRAASAHSPTAERDAVATAAVIEHAPLIEAQVAAPVARSRAELLSSLPESMPQVGRDAIVGEIARKRGTQRETAVLDAMPARVDRRNDQFFRTFLWYTNAEGRARMMVGGRVDGIAHDKDGVPYLVEAKHRHERLMVPVPDYEEVQCQTLMHVTKIHRCVLVQQVRKHGKLQADALLLAAAEVMKGEKDGAIDHRHVTELEYSSADWNEIQDALKAFAAKLDALVDDPARQERLLWNDEF